MEDAFVIKNTLDLTVNQNFVIAHIVLLIKMIGLLNYAFIVLDMVKKQILNSKFKNLGDCIDSKDESICKCYDGWTGKVNKI